MKVANLTERHLHTVSMDIEDAESYGGASYGSPRERMPRRPSRVQAKTASSIVGPHSEWTVTVDIQLIKQDGTPSALGGNSIVFYPDRNYPQPIEDAVQAFLDETGISMSQVMRWSR